MINSTVYIFGALGDGYVQYPDDYAKAIFQKFSRKMLYKSQLIIHRKGDLMYYGYIRQLDTPSQYIGFCVLLNGVMLSNPTSLFAAFENIVTCATVSGDLLTLNEQGELIASVKNLLDNRLGIHQLSKMIKNAIDAIEPSLKGLPPVDYSVSNAESKVFSVEDSLEDIVTSSCKYAYTLIVKDKNCDTASLRGYKGVIVRLNKKNQRLESGYEQLNKQYEVLKRQKNQYKKVMVLFLVVILCAIGLYFTRDALNESRVNLEQTRQKNSQLHSTVNVLKGKERDLSSEVDKLKSVLSNVRNQRDRAETELHDFESIHQSRQPLLITKTSYSFSAGRLYFDYYGYCNQTIRLDVVAFSGANRYRNSANITIYKGMNYNASIFVSRYLKSYKDYLFVLYINGKVVGGGFH